MNVRTPHVFAAAMAIAAWFSWPATAISQPVALEVTRAEIGYDQRTGQPIVTVTFSEAGRAVFGRLTTENVGRYLEMRVGGKAVMKAMIREPIIGGRGQIMAETPEKGRIMVEHLSKSGARIEAEIVPGP